jgi:glucokinase
MPLLDAFAQRRAMLEQTARQPAPAAAPATAGGTWYRGRFIPSARSVADNSATLLRMLDRLPVAVKNDTNLAIFGESLRGAARNRQDVLGVFIGTGIGGGLYLRGSLYAGHGGLAGEIGHSVVDPTGPECPCGQRGCLERYASATGLRERAHARAQRFDSPLAREVRNTGTGPSVAVLDSHLAEGDSFAVHLVHGAAEALAHIIGITVNLIAPEMVVVGGGVAEGMPKLVSRIAHALPRYTLPATHAQTCVEPAVLGHRAGAIGAALFGLRAFAGDM